MTMRRDKSERHGDGKRTAILPSVPAAVPDPANPLASQDPAVLLAMCVFGEARCESEAVQRAVAQVVLNRARNPHPVFGSRAGAAFEDNLRHVILRPGQFSCFHPSDPNYHKLLRPLEAEDPAVWERCLRSAEEALVAQNQPDTLTANSDHYFDDSILPPSWADPAKRTVKLGRLNFYRLYLPAPQLEILEIPTAEFPPSSDGQSGAAAPNLRSALSPAASQALPAVLFPSQEPSEQEPSAGRPSPATGLVPGSEAAKPCALRRGLSRNGAPHPMSLSRRIPHSTWSSRLLKLQREPRPGRLSSLQAVTSRTTHLCRSECPVTSRPTAHDRPLPTTLLFPSALRLSLITRHLSLLFACLLLAGCNEFERAAYRTLAVTQAEYETVQRQVAEAAAHGLITERQWNRFAVQGHRFIDAHNSAVDAFELWSRAKNPANEARLQALLEILPRLIRELNNFVESFESQPERPDSEIGTPDSGSARVPNSESPIAETQWR